MCTNKYSICFLCVSVIGVLCLSVTELRAEIEKLRNQKGIDDDEDIIQASLTEIETLRQKLASKEKEMAAKER